MNPHAWIHGQHDRMLERVIDWANVNSGSANEAGLNHVAEKIQREFEELDPDSSTLQFLAEAATTRRPLIRVAKRPNIQKRCCFLDISIRSTASITPSNAHVCWPMDDSTGPEFVT